MKKQVILVLTIVSLIFASCETETNQFDTTPDANLNATTMNNFGPDVCNGEKDLFERQLHWFAFISGKVIPTSEDIQTEISTALNNLTNGETISAETLIGPSSTMPHFKDKFLYYLNFYAEGSAPEPDTDTEKPGEPVIPDPFSPLTPEEIVEAFMAAMLDDNCVELYFPVGVNFTPTYFNLTTAAHPLTNATCNEAIKRYGIIQYPGGIYGGGGGYEEGFTTAPVTVKPSYLVSNQNIIIARPIRLALNPSCTYDDYMGVDFMNFLD